MALLEIVSSVALMYGSAVNTEKVTAPINQAVRVVNEVQLITDKAQAPSVENIYYAQQAYERIQRDLKD